MREEETGLSFLNFRGTNTSKVGLKPAPASCAQPAHQCKASTAVQPPTRTAYRVNTTD